MSIDVLSSLIQFTPSALEESLPRWYKPFSSSNTSCTTMLLWKPCLSYVRRYNHYLDLLWWMAFPDQISRDINIFARLDQLHIFLLNDSNCGIKLPKNAAYSYVCRDTTARIRLGLSWKREQKLRRHSYVVYYCLSSSQKPVPGKMFLTIQQQVFRISLVENISNSARATMCGNV